MIATRASFKRQTQQARWSEIKSRRLTLSLSI
jgi:hypothetical protein